MTSLVQKSQMVGEAVAKSSEGLSRIKQKSLLISNHVDDANRIMRRMSGLPFVAKRLVSSVLAGEVCSHSNTLLLSLVSWCAPSVYGRHSPLLRAPSPVLIVATQVLMITCAYIISKRV